MSGVAVGLLVAMIVGGTAATVPADPAHAAEDMLTSSAVTLASKDDALNPVGTPFPDLEVTISQTKDLVSQGIRLSWTGGKKSTPPSGTVGGTNFLQIAQCWGEDPDNPGHPDRRTCQYGGTLGWGAKRDGTTLVEHIAERDAKYSADLGYAAYTGIPFVAYNAAREVDEEKAPADRVLTNLKTGSDGQPIVKPDNEFVDLNMNPFFTALMTNEVKWAPAGVDGSGSVPFEVQTAMQSPGLGCGTPVTSPGGATVGESCWLVVIPRGTGDSGQSLINKSGLWWDAWQHHVAVKLEFKPLGVRCQIGAAERQLAGSELIAEAMASWQPALCLGENGSPFVLSKGNEADALRRAAGTAPSPLAFTSRPLDPEVISGTTDPLAYAAVSVSSVAISFAIDRQPKFGAGTEYEARAGLPLTEMKLTPRLVAKLLTASYVDALPRDSDKSHIGYESFEEPGENPRTIVQDPDFLQFNDSEWAAQNMIGASVADAVTPSGRSDLAVRVWEYVLSDAEATDWLAGNPDPWGMIVNPYYSTNPDINPTGLALGLPADSFPKADPVEKPDSTQLDPANGTGPVNLVTWRPYTTDFADSAHRVLRGDGQILGAWDKFSVPPKYGKSVPELFGSQKVIGVTSSPAARLYETVTAQLRNPAGQFVAPTQDGLAAAAAAMTPTAQPKVLALDFESASAKAAPTAYPLAMPVYAALNPQQTDAAQRAVYANLIRYAVGEGQTPGSDVGELPPGYAPLPKSWVNQALLAADTIEHGIDPNAVAPVAPVDAPAANLAMERSSAKPVTPPVAAAPATSTSPNATGESAGALAGTTTPDDPELGPAGAAVPAGLLSGLAAALAVPVLSRIRRRT
ncbi:hypothetical protein [Diaminobutyricimonas sp. LJ205]|uniref:hypothetical protein n=1 Tax=Diaminobutyricimonas sp. LJ205 TaxID=2683590 RepID=UPI0012F486A3|nr:hypothetical protein [Diaminobutyricimonas sp. LJ205]